MGNIKFHLQQTERHRELSPFRARSVGGLEVERVDGCWNGIISGSPKAKPQSMRLGVLRTLDSPDSSETIRKMQFYIILHFAVALISG